MNDDLTYRNAAPASTLLSLEKLSAAEASAETSAPEPDEVHVSRVHAGQWRLDRVELVNWGTFGGHHTIDVARRGFLLTGHSGSGKSSVVDAVTTVLTPPSKVRFNAAAADAGQRRSDRSVAAYVRGAWRRQADEATGEVVSDHLRPGATWSGIALRFDDGRPTSAPIILVKLMHLRAGESSQVSELYLVAAQPLDLLELQPYARDGLQTRAIKAAWPDATVTDRHAVFAARFCRALGVRGENALQLLHRTQAAKNLGSLDDLFRGFMLDEPTTFTLADTAVEQFTELASAHAHVVTAREQIRHLAPLRALAATFDAAEQEAAARAALIASLPAFTDAWALELARAERRELEQREQEARHDLDEARRAADEAERLLRSAELTVMQHGGEAHALRRTAVERAAERLQQVQRQWDVLAGRLREVGVDAPTTFADYTELRAVAQRERAEADEAGERERREMYGLHSGATAARERLTAIDRELTALKHARSNLPAVLLEARALVCRTTGLRAEVLPFAGELLEVRPEHGEWQGPIERVLRPLATVMLVPPVHRDVVLAAVDSQHLRARLVLEVLPAQAEQPRLVGDPGSLVHRVQVKDGSARAWLEWVLSRQYDLPCVRSEADLAGLDRGVTRAGLVKRGRGRHEKDDRFPVDDRDRWVLGFDNAEKVERLVEQRRRATAEFAQAEQRIEQAGRAAETLRDRRAALRVLEDREWSELDVQAARGEHDRCTAALAELLATRADLREARAAESAARTTHESARAVVDEAHEAHAAARQELAAIDQRIEERERRALGPVPEAHHAELEPRFYQVQRSVRSDVVDRLASAVQTQLQRERDAALRRGADTSTRITSLQSEARHRWPALTGDLTDAVADRDGYLQVLGRLEADRLPDFEERFFGLLETQSQRNIGQLAAVIRRAPGEIRDKIAPINSSLLRSPFDRRRYLQIKVDEARTAAVQDLLADLREISSGSWSAHDRATSERRFDVMARVMRRLGSSESGDRAWRTACLDTRRHVRFTGVEVDPEGVQLNVYDSSAGLSGGQRQKLVVFCLAAALRYQLTDEGDDVPHFGTVILDEAFDKADASFTRMAMDVFVAFGFHMVLATPLKLLQTLEDYVGGVGLATCRDFRDSRIGLVTFDDVRELDTAGVP